MTRHGHGHEENPGHDDTPTDGFTRIDMHLGPGLGDDIDAVAISEGVSREMRSAAEVLGTSVPRESLQASKRVSWRIGVFAVVLALIVSIGVGVSAILIATDAAGNVAVERVDRKATEERTATVQSATDAAIDQLKASNAQLAARGQAPVTVPGPDSSGSDAIVAATTAQVLAALPKQPTSAEIGQQIAALVASQPTGPSAAQLSAAVADYLQKNPAPAGATGQQGVQGAKGDKGDPPTAEEIQAAVAQWAVDHPDEARGPRGFPPASWTQPGPLPGQTLTCTRDAGSPDMAATYTCA